MLWALLGFVGVFVGAFGTLIGAAGGFLLVPILLVLYPHDTPATVTSITLTVAFFNALSGSIEYGRLKRIDYRSGLMFAVASAPGAIIGASATASLDRGLFQTVFGATLVVVAIYLFARPRRRQGAISIGPAHAARRVVDSEGGVFVYSFSLLAGMPIAFGVGFMSGLLGIGGGIIHVPALTQLLSFPAHIATATSHFVVALSTPAAVAVHAISGAFTEGARRAVVLSVGAVIGAQWGARWSRRVSGPWLIRLLAVGLALVGMRMLIAPS
jgi:uncharacterized membrane protein YfcA